MPRNAVERALWTRCVRNVSCRRNKSCLFIYFFFQLYFIRKKKKIRECKRIWKTLNCKYIQMRRLPLNDLHSIVLTYITFSISSIFNFFTLREEAKGCNYSMGYQWRNVDAIEYYALRQKRHLCIIYIRHNIAKGADLTAYDTGARWVTCVTSLPFICKTHDIPYAVS